jgi:hypothetical protein
MRSLKAKIKILVTGILFLNFIYTGAVVAESRVKASNTASFNDSTNNLIRVFPTSSKFAHKTVLTFTLANPQKVTIRIYDVDGREVAYLMERNVPAGTFELLLETKNLKKGVYFCKFFTGDKIPMKKMITVK